MSLPNTLFESSKANEGVTSLVIGSMGTATLQRCISIFNKASIHRLNHSKGGSLFQYGPGSGFPDYLIELQKFLQNEYNSEVRLEDLFGTAGATSGLWLAADLLLPKKKGIVFVENPTYFLALDILIRDLGHTPVCLPMESDGVDIKAFTEIIKKEVSKREGSDGEKGHFWAMYYTIPTHHNPTSIVTSENKCKKIVDLAREYNFFVLCDDVYNLLTFSGPSAPKRLFAYDDPNDKDYKGGNIISNGSFSKILCPGIRVGWMEMSPKLKPIFENSSIITSGGALNNYTSGIVASAIKLGLLKEHMELIKMSYKNKMSIAVKCLEEGLPEGFTFHRPSGGNFIWIQGDAHFNSNSFKKILHAKNKIEILSGVDCSPYRFIVSDNDDPEETMSNAFRISISFNEEPVLVKAIQTICKELKENS